MISIREMSSLDINRANDNIMDEVYNRKAGNIQMIQNASRQYAYDIMGIDAAKTAKNILEGQD